jgi:hypothetical protein
MYSGQETQSKKGWEEVRTDVNGKKKKKFAAPGRYSSTQTYIFSRFCEEG